MNITTEGRMMNLPRLLRYRTIKPRGFAQQYKRLTVNPQMSFQNFRTNELVRFLLTTDGFIDPYNSFIQVDVNCEAADLGRAGLMLDGMSTSLIQEMILTLNNREIERVSEYDQIGQIFHDLRIQPQSFRNKNYQGGVQVRPHAGQGDGRQNYAFYTDVGHAVGTLHQINGCGYFPERPFQIDAGNYLPNVADPLYVPTMIKLNAHITDTTVQSIGDRQNLVDYAKLYAALNPTTGIDSPNTTPINYAFTRTAPYWSTALPGCSTRGYKIPTSSAMSEGNTGVFLHPTAYQLKIKNGYATNPPDTGILTAAPNDSIKRYTFYVPFLSGIMGLLIPTADYKLIPANALYGLQIDIRMNPYAFFTSGFFDDTTNTQAPRQWSITNIQLQFDLWYFDDITTRQINEALNGEGIILSSQNFSLGPQYQVARTSELENTWQLNNTIESCNILFFWVLQNLYQAYTYCRKQYRLSGNITQYQIKVGPDFIPQYPITGHGGNVAKNDTIAADNTPFLWELNKACSIQFSPDQATNISPASFALNSRLYNPSTTATLGITDSQLALFQETRVRGKAIYAIVLDSNPHDQDVISGFDTTKKRPIELQIKADQTYYYNGACTLYTAFYHDFVVQFRANGQTLTFGQG